jgi:serine/threonine protein kinase
MTLAAGSKLGPYEIVAPLGAGGMGEVYRARDTRLERTVAIKILPAMARQLREVRRRALCSFQKWKKIGEGPLAAKGAPDKDMLMLKRSFPFGLKSITHEPSSDVASFRRLFRRGEHVRKPGLRARQARAERL